MNDPLRDALRRPRLLLGAGGAATAVSFFTLTWIDLLFIRSTGFDLARSASYANGKTALLWVVIAAAAVALVAAVTDEKRLATLSGVLSVAGVAVLVCGVVIAVNGAQVLGQRFSLVGYLGLEYWLALVGLAVTIFGAYSTLRGLSATEP